MADNMGGGMGGPYETPSKESAYRGFLGLVCCEFIFHLIWPIVYGLYFFRVVGKQNEPGVDCYADEYNPEAVPGVMKYMDEGTQLVNVSH